LRQLILDFRFASLCVGIGSRHPQSLFFSAAVPSTWHDQPLAAGFRADLCATLIDDGGNAPHYLTIYALLEISTGAVYY
jgi:hypothetical protein